jgi:hypothetical protein
VGLKLALTIVILTVPLISQSYPNLLSSPGNTVLDGGIGLTQTNVCICGYS